MIDILLKTLPFFALVGIGYGAAASRSFPPEATSWLTRFVFYVSLPALLLAMGAKLDPQALFDGAFVAAYLTGSFLVYGLTLGIARARGAGLAEAAIEAQCAIIGNTAFLGIPLLVALLGPAAMAPVILVLVIDMLVFNVLITLLVTLGQSGRIEPRVIKTLGREILRNPILIASIIGVGWGASGIGITAPLDDTLTLLGSASTPVALFAIGASLAGRRLERVGIAIWLAFAKLALHPAAVALAAFAIFAVDPFAAAVMTITAALPVAGNVYLLAVHYGVAPQRVSAAILISTALSLLSLTLLIAHLTGP